MQTLRHIWLNASYEWRDAIRSRRALIILLLYLITAVGTMYWSISLLHKLENDLATLLNLPTSQQTGAVSSILWQSKPFQQMMAKITQDNLVLQDIQGKHPVELIYAWFVFFYTPLLVVLVSANRIAEDLGSGAVRYVLCRATRLSWTLGKFFGQTSMVALALILSGATAFLVAKIRLATYAPPELLPNILLWSLRAWIYALPFLGLAMGLSHLTRSASKATVMGIIAIAVLKIATVLLRFFTTHEGWRAWFPQIAMVMPDTHKMLLWRSTWQPLLLGTTWLLALTGCFLFIGFAMFMRRDA